MLTLLALLPLVAVWLADSQIDIQITNKVFFLGLYFYLLWLTFIWILFFLAWTDHYLDVWIITDRRIIDIEQRGIFNREVSNLRLDRIQDITVSVKGFLPTLLSFGDLHVQTAGHKVEIIFRNAINPYHAKEIINRLHDQEIKGGDEQTASIKQY